MLLTRMLIMLSSVTSRTDGRMPVSIYVFMIGVNFLRSKSPGVAQPRLNPPSVFLFPNDKRFTHAEMH